MSTTTEQPRTMARFDGKDPYEIKVKLSPEYFEGRKAFEDGVNYWENPHHAVLAYQKRLDWSIGHDDARYNVSPADRQEAERVGETFNV